MPYYISSPFFLVADTKNKSQLHVTREKMLEACVEDRTNNMISRHAHFYDEAEYDCHLWKNAKKDSNWSMSHPIVRAWRR